MSGLKDMDKVYLDRAIIQTIMNQATMNQATMDRATMNQATMDQAIMDRATMSQATMNQAIMDRATMEQVITERPTRDQAMLAGPYQAAPVGMVLVDDQDQDEKRGATQSLDIEVHPLAMATLKPSYHSGRMWYGSKTRPMVSR